MKQIKNSKIRFPKWIILPTLAIATFLCSRIAFRNPQWIERYYSEGLYPFLAQFLSVISSPIPFSLDDIFYLVLIFVPFILLFLLLLKKTSLIRSGIQLLNLYSAVYILFYLLWGFNYFREGLAERIGLKEAQVSQDEFNRVLEQLIGKTNQLQCNFDDFDREKIDQAIEESYKSLSPVLKIHYPMGNRTDKKITFSRFYAKTGITGYFGPFFNEVHVNKKVLPVEFPYVLAHEKAHQLGITSEAEANFYSWLICSNSSSQQVQYSGNLFILYHFLLQGYESDRFKEMVNKLSPEVKNDFRNIQQHWKELRNETLDKTASKVNDAYLKTNKIKEGIKDYRGVVKHVMNFSLDSTFQQQHNLMYR